MEGAEGGDGVPRGALSEQDHVAESGRVRVPDPALRSTPADTAVGECGWLSGGYVPEIRPATLPGLGFESRRNMIRSAT